MTALWDFFVCPEGPRLRDRISHGVRHPEPPWHASHSTITPRRQSVCIP
jgi:hypothetical protein